MPAQKYFFDPHKDRLVRDAYTSANYGRHEGPVKALARQLGIPRAILLRRARKLGLNPKVADHGREWTPEEDAILVEHGWRSPTAVSRRMARAGFSRSPGAVELRLKRHHQLGREGAREEAGIYKQAEVCRLLGVDHRLLNSLISSGKLPAVAEGNREDGRPAHWLIKEKDIRNLVINFTAHLNFARIDKYWLVDLLTRRSGLKQAD